MNKMLSLQRHWPALLFVVCLLKAPLFLIVRHIQGGPFVWLTCFAEGMIVSVTPALLIVGVVCWCPFTDWDKEKRKRSFFLISSILMILVWLAPK